MSAKQLVDPNERAEQVCCLPFVCAPKHSLIIRAVVIIGQISSTAYIYYVPQYPLHGFNTIYVWNTQRIAYVVYIRKDERER